MLTKLVGISVLLSLVWLYLLSTFTSAILTLTSIALPLSFIGVSIDSFHRFLTIPGKQTEITEYNALAAISFVGILGGLYTAYTIYKSRKMFATMVVLVGLATEILMANTALFVLSATLALIHLGFSIFWLWLFAHIFLQGKVISEHGGLVSIILDPTAPWIVFFFILVYFWTASIFQNVEKVTVSSVVGEWYFDR